MEPDEKIIAAWNRRASHSFQEVMRQAQRMCLAHPECRDCKAFTNNRTCGFSLSIFQQGENNDAYAHFEHAVLDWAQEYPEPEASER